MSGLLGAPDGCSGVVSEDLVHLGHHGPLDDVHLLQLFRYHQAVRPASPSVVNATNAVGCGKLAHKTECGNHQLAVAQQK